MSSDNFSSAFIEWACPMLATETVGSDDILIVLSSALENYKPTAEVGSTKEDLIIIDEVAKLQQYMLTNELSVVTIYL